MTGSGRFGGPLTGDPCEVEMISGRRYSAPRIETAPLNWRRGLFRLWLLVSTAWIMAWAIYFILSAMAHALNTAGDFLAIPVVFFGPPVALLFCGLATRWAINGFRQDEPL